MRLFIIVLLLSVSEKICLAQEVKPVHYWNFDNDDYLRASISGKMVNVKNYNCPVEQKRSEIGKGIDLGRKSCLVVTSGLSRSISNSFSIEFLFKGSQFNFIAFPQQSFILRLNSNGLFFRTSHRYTNNRVETNDLSIPFKRSGLETYHYYTDDKWHHIVFTFNSATGVKRIWVDGQSPENFACIVSPSGELVVPANDGFKDTDMIDELAIYKAEIPESLIQQHYYEVQDRKTYTFSVGQAKALKQQRKVISTWGDTKEKLVDPLEFAPGYPEYTIQATDQLKSFPLPRINPYPKLRRNVSWMDISYLHRELPGNGGKGFGNTSPRKAVDISEEMARNWNYYLDVPVLRTTAEAAKKNYTNSNTIYGALVDYVNRNPQYPYASILIQAQAKPIHAGLDSKTAYIISQTLPDKYYMQDENGAPVKYNNKKWLSPLMPLDVQRKDGETVRFYLEQLLKYVNTPPTLLNENGEVFGHARPAELLKKDPKVWEDFKRSGLSLSQYSGKFQATLDSVYRNTILQLPSLDKTKFSFYNVSATNGDYWPAYDMRRSISRWDNTTNYSTPDFYPRTPDNWMAARGAFNGYGPIASGRKTEIEMGEKYFSPYVSAGWGNEEANIRPAQYLALLKAMVMLGADFFYVGYFNVTGKNGKWPNGAGPNDPRGYAYQIAMPVYAQALRTWAPEFFENGMLLNPAPVNEKMKQFRFQGKSDHELILVRKFGNKYLIFGSLQPSSNVKGNVPAARLTTINLDGKQVTFEIRRQGSIYILNLDETEPRFFQLDKWHQFEHPYYWTRHIVQEAELFSSKKGKVDLITRGNSKLDFTTYSTEILMQQGSIVRYEGSIRPGLIKKIRIITSNRVNADGAISVSVGDKQKVTLSIKSGEGKEYFIDGNQFKQEKFTGSLILEVIKGSAQIDSFIIEVANP